MIHAKGTRLSATSTPTDVNAKPRTVQPGESQSGKAQCAQRLSAMKLPHRKEPVANKDLNNHRPSPGSDFTVLIGGNYK